MSGAPPTDADIARQIGVTTRTLRRWVDTGVVPKDGAWTPPAIAHARIVARLRERGHTLREIAAAADAGRLSFAYIEDLLPAEEGSHTIDEAARETGLEPALIERIFSTMGLNQAAAARITEDDLQLLRYVAAVLSAGFPLVAFLQLLRVYGQAVAQMADAEVRLFHLYVHEPLMRDGVPGLEMAEEMWGLAAELLPLASPIMDHVHQRFLAHFVEQDVIGHMEADLEDTLPDDARVIKTIGDEVMVVGSDASALVDWAVGFQALHDERPLPRIGLHYGQTLYRDGDYYGREVNQAARVAARAAGGEVLCTQPVVEQGGPHLEFERIGEVRLKGFSEPTELFLARQREE
jgi:adenylate cyclase